MKHVFLTIIDELQIVSKLWKRNLGMHMFERQRGAIATPGTLVPILIICSLHFCPVLHKALVCVLQVWQSSEKVAVIC